MDLVDDPSSSYYSAVFEIPGINKDSISLGIRAGKLFISGRRHAPYLKPTKLDTAIPNATQSGPDEPAAGVAQRALRIPVRELRYGNFERHVDIPAGIKVNT
jgi:HSP20 family protein